MAYDGSLIFDTKVDTAGFNKGTNTLKKQAAGLSNTFKKLGVTIAGAFAVKKFLMSANKQYNWQATLKKCKTLLILLLAKWLIRWKSLLTQL